jgi:hypothetical protein
MTKALRYSLSSSLLLYTSSAEPFKSMVYIHVTVKGGQHTSLRHAKEDASADGGEGQETDL